MQEADRPGISSGIARPPYNRNATVFRDAVYRDPGTVSLMFPGLEGEGPSVLWVDDMQPGDQIKVFGRHSDHRWSVFLVCEGVSRFRVHRLQPTDSAEEAG